MNVYAYAMGSGKKLDVHKGFIGRKGVYKGGSSSTQAKLQLLTTPSTPSFLP
jgi:hypothetical protein